MKFSFYTLGCWGIKGSVVLKKCAMQRFGRITADTFLPSRIKDCVASIAP